MREMKDSGIDWIGEVPIQWQLVPTKRIFKGKKQIVGGNSDMYERLALTMNGVVKRNKDDNEGLQPEQFDNYQILESNELVFKLIDLQNIRTSRVGLSPYTGIVSPAYIILTNTKADNRFYYYWYFDMYNRCVFNRMGGDGVRSALNLKDVLEIPIPMISDTEQHRIAEFLDRKCAEVDEMIGLQEQIIEELKAYKQSVITETVTKGLKPDVPMKDSGIEWIGEIPEHWRIGKIKMIAKTNSGSTPKTISQTEKSSIVWIRTTDINDNLVTDSSLHLTQEELNSASCPMLNKDVCVVAMYGGGGTIGKCGILGVEATINQALCSIEVKSFHLGAFMFWTLRATRYNWMKFAVGTRKDPNISQEIVRNYIVPIPPIEEQQKISDYLNTKCTEIDNLISIKQSKIDSLKEYKKSIIYEYVTGKREVE